MDSGHAPPPPPGPPPPSFRTQQSTGTSLSKLALENDFTNHPVASTISRDAAKGNTAREEDILSSMGRKSGIDDSRYPGIPPPRLVNWGSLPPPRPAGAPPPDSGRLEPRKYSQASSSGSRSQDDFGNFLPESWKPTWPTVLHDADQNQIVNWSFGQEKAGSNNDRVRHRNGDEFYEKISNPSVHAESTVSREQSTPQMENQNTISSAYVDQQRVKLNVHKPFESLPNVAHILAQIGSRTLGVDLHTNSKEAKFFGYVLDIIEKVDTINSVLWQRLEHPEQEVHTPDQVELPKSPLEEGPHTQVLHRIYCFDWNHAHDRVAFEDEPRETDETESHGRRRSSSRKLHADKPIRDLDSYLNSNPHICLIVFREHVCKKGLSYARQTFRSSVWVSPRNERLLIVSELLKRKLTELSTCEPDTSDILSLDEEMDAPYNFLYHHRVQIAKLVENGDEETRKHASLLHEFLENNYREEYLEADEQFKSCVVSKRHLSKLFKPNQVIIRQTNNTPTAHIVSEWPEPLEGDEDILILGFWSWDFDGQKLTRKLGSQRLHFGVKERIPIPQLACFPLDYAPQTTLQALINRGRKFWDLREKYFASYSGWDAHHDEQYSNGRFMIDMSTYRKIHKETSNNIHTVVDIESHRKKYDYWPTEIDISQTADDNVLILLPPHIPGFEMQTKKWVNLNIEQIGPVIWNQRAFERLVLEEKLKELIKALVTVHVSTNKMGDIISGKGTGLVILLHGSPGVGKTLTAGNYDMDVLDVHSILTPLAESVAELAKKPLYRVTCGDIGTEAEKIERYLETVMYLGKIWDCVLLIDEADVFLEERTMADIQRNSLVSVFLRLLEFYDGILILTSNRVGTFDEAFNSRIQVALHYRPLTKNFRKQIWQNFLKMLEEQDVEVDTAELESRVEELAAEDMNGRQIRNCVLTAQQLATHNKERLGWEHLSQAIKTSVDFKKYLKSVHGHTDEQWAREERLR